MQRLPSSALRLPPPPPGSAPVPATPEEEAEAALGELELSGQGPNPPLTTEEQLQAIEGYLPEGEEISPEPEYSQSMPNAWGIAQRLVAGQPEYGGVPVNIASQYLSPFWREAKTRTDLSPEERFMWAVNRAREKLKEDFGERIGPYSKQNVKSPIRSPRVPRQRIRTTPMIPVGMEAAAAAAVSSRTRGRPRGRGQGRLTSEFVQLRPDVTEEVFANIPPGVEAELTGAPPAAAIRTVPVQPPSPRCPPCPPLPARVQRPTPIVRPPIPPREPVSPLPTSPPLKPHARVLPPVPKAKSRGRGRPGRTVPTPRAKPAPQQLPPVPVPRVSETEQALPPEIVYPESETNPVQSVLEQAETIYRGGYRTSEGNVTSPQVLSPNLNT